VKVAPNEQQGLAGVASNLATVTQCEILVLPCEIMNDWRALPIILAQLARPKVARSEMLLLLGGPELSRLDCRMPACLEDTLELNPECFGACL